MNTAFNSKVTIQKMTCGYGHLTLAEPSIMNQFLHLGKRESRILILVLPEKTGKEKKSGSFTRKGDEKRKHREQKVILPKVQNKGTSEKIGSEQNQ